jgi:hypothetical protein
MMAWAKRSGASSVIRRRVSSTSDQRHLSNPVGPDSLMGGQMAMRLNKMMESGEIDR